MANTRLSQSKFLLIVANIFGTIGLGYGINAIIWPLNALEPFEFQAPTAPADRRLVENLMVIYGARDVFIGLAIYAAAYFRDRRTLGSILIAFSGVAFVDGVVCHTEGRGEWNRWGYAPMVLVVGSLLLGVLDRT